MCRWIWILVAPLQVPCLSGAARGPQGWGRSDTYSSERQCYHIKNSFTKLVPLYSTIIFPPLPYFLILSQSHQDELLAYYEVGRYDPFLLSLIILAEPNPAHTPTPGEFGP
ncbi:uncharacterized protein RAG0_03316 [Rhynchosporium agropyri]|uniref:Uncharacterized protein n=1 Tax=Rhynchosporium agropyri TaxID=914238 RepID=A0A1E1K3Y8_9HELO|nr:uncharacterized protein RAG0_03316 [Rhynchosporium agropyri]